MKTSIKTLLDSYVSDNNSLILENGGNVAEYILADTEAQDQGWLWFLGDDEISEYENASSERRHEIRNEIRNFVNENYNYNLRSEALMEKWIVVKFIHSEDDTLHVTRRDNFEEMNMCDAYTEYGQTVGCENAGCYAFSNSESCIAEDCYEQHFTYAFKHKNEDNESIWGLVRENLEMSYMDFFRMLVECESDFISNFEITEEKYADILEWFNAWKEENESHTKCTAWTYHDSHNFCTAVLSSDLDKCDCEEIDEDEELEILLQMPESTPYIAGTNETVEGEDYNFLFDRWATNPWFCYVEKK